MGCDIHGAIEACNSHGRWMYGADVGGLVGRSYDTFGSLWGVRNSVGFDPLFEQRGFPKDMSIETKHRIDRWGGVENLGAVDLHSASWATIEEIRDVDWSEEAERLDSRYSILDENKEFTGHKAGGFGEVSGWSDVIRENREAIDNGEAIPNDDGSAYIQRRMLTREEALSGAWEWLLFDLMETFDDRYDGVRMVVWFDN